MQNKIWTIIRPYRFAIAGPTIWGGLQLTGYTNAVIGWVLFGAALILLVTPAIEHKFGLQLLLDPYPKVPAKRKTVLNLSEPISHLLVLMAFITAITMFVVHWSQTNRQINAIIKASVSSATPALAPVFDKSFYRETVTLDGHVFYNCRFDKVMFIYNGNGTQFVNCYVSPNIGIDSGRPEFINILSLLMNLRLLTGRGKAEYYPEGKSMPVPWSP